MSEVFAPDPEIHGKLRQFHRILMSYIDFKEAAAISSSILDDDLHADPSENRVLLRALNQAMIVSYCRPFSGNDGRNGIPDLPGRFLRDLTAAEKAIHDVVVGDRNAALAHSDSAAWNLRPVVLKVRGKLFLAPVHDDVHAPLTKEATIEFRDLCLKLLESTFQARMRLEPEVIRYLEVVDVDESGLGS